MAGTASLLQSGRCLCWPHVMPGSFQSMGFGGICCFPDQRSSLFTKVKSSKPPKRMSRWSFPAAWTAPLVPPDGAVGWSLVLDESGASWKDGGYR